MKSLSIIIWSAILVISLIILSALPVAADGFTDAVMVKDINPGTGSSNPHFLRDVAGTLFFTAQDGTNRMELWKSDGTGVGTVMVKDIYPGTGGSYPYDLTDVAGTLFFGAYDGTNGEELWKSDGTESGTVMVKDIYPGGEGSLPDNLTDVAGTLFFTAQDGTNGLELWKSESISEYLVEIDIKPGSDPNSINLKSKGMVPVAVLTTSDFDASTIDADTVFFADAQPVRWTLEDVDSDGDLDMLFHFKTQDLNLTQDSTEATLVGETNIGQSIEGTDTVKIVPKSK